MKHRFHLIRHVVLAALPALVFMAAGAAHAQTATGVVGAEIADPLRVVEVDGLHFGTIIPDADGGRVNIRRNSGACNAQQGVTLVGGTCQRGAFQVSGPADQRVRISTDAAPITLNRQGGGATMTMDRIRINGNANKRLDNAGQLTFYVAGRLQVGGGQMEGLYDATYNVTVEYR